MSWSFIQPDKVLETAVIPAGVHIWLGRGWTLWGHPYPASLPSLMLGIDTVGRGTLSQMYWLWTEWGAWRRNRTHAFQLLVQYLYVSFHSLRIPTGFLATVYVYRNEAVLPQIGWARTISWKWKIPRDHVSNNHFVKSMHKGTQLSCTLNKDDFQHRTDTPAKFQVSLAFCRGARVIIKIIKPLTS